MALGRQLCSIRSLPGAQRGCRSLARPLLALGSTVLGGRSHGGLIALGQTRRFRRSGRSGRFSRRRFGPGFGYRTGELLGRDAVSRPLLAQLRQHGGSALF